MNFAQDDLIRSLRRYVSLALGSPPWTVRTERQPVRDDERPVAVCEPASGVTTGRARRSIPQGDVDKLQAFSTMAYPAMADTARGSRLAATECAQLLDDAFTFGLVDEETGVDIGGPLMLPVFDFEDVPVEGPDRAGPAEPYGFARVDDLTVRPVQDAVDHLRYTVACDVRLSWSQGGRLRPDAPVVGSMPGTFSPTP